jgi:hypothetical protein
MRFFLREGQAEDYDVVYSSENIRHSKDVKEVKDLKSVDPSVPV